MDLFRAAPLGLLILAISAEPMALASPEEPASQPSSRPAVKVVRMQDLLEQAVEHYQRSEFDQARRLLQEIVGYLGQERSRTAQEAHTHLAFVHVAFGETEEAVAAFERALEIRPDLELSAPAPKIARAFAQARRRYRARVRALDHDPPLLSHEPPREARYGDSVSIEVDARDLSGVERVVLNYRIAGNRGYSSVKLERTDRGRHVATIPAGTVVRPGIQYYVEAWDRLGNGPGLKGSAGAPIRIQVKGGPVARSTIQGPDPWYKRWWVWAIASGVVAAAGGIGAAAYLTRQENARFNVQLPRELNP